MADRGKARKDNKGRALLAGESQRSDGRYMFRYSENGGGCVYARDLQELREKEKEIQRDMLDGIFTKLATTTTLNELFEKDMKAKNYLRESTKHNYFVMWNGNVRDGLGKMKVCNIKSVHIRTFYANLESEGIGHNTIKFLHNMIRSALEVAVQSDLIRKNPAVGVKYGGEVQEKKALTKAEQESLLGFLNGETIYNIYLPMVTIMIGTGLRVSELCGLTWNDINFKENTITVNKQLLKTRGKAEDGKTLYIEKTKTENGKRSIPMTEAVHKAFRDQQKLMLMLQRKCFTEIDGVTNFCFVTKNHFPFSVANVNASLKNIISAHNKVNDLQLPQFSAHVLRHTGATRMIESGMSPKAVQTILGHSSIKITMDVYVNLDEKHIQEEMKKAESIIKFA